MQTPRPHATPSRRTGWAVPGLLALLLSLVGGTALLLPGTVAAEQQYDVELIIFRQWEARGDDAEAWPLSVGAPHFGRWQPLGARGFQRLSGNQLRLHGARQRLEQSDAYDPLLHIGWRQEGLPRNRSVAVPLPPAWMPPQAPEEWAPSLEPQRLYGLVRVYRERFLHAVIDLRYRRDTGDRDALLPAGAVHALQQSRRMRSDELHYLDHPVLGVLIQIRPVD
ncbi:peptidoglycan binding protein CsiV [Alkalilimnicola ehrlichii MLHE-1]|uniref:Uncharacterized protein n=1 Tax=Alkalilimnicola ehrlichii (strain ATCC BAA-1101 / DSM 17681 / MLHE-1) TaxID=187272 RepID=Q0A7P2_ALKEH|nr:peptidoglycan binding protein CsiV [Alkalilimnicola ehrlichii]ABI57145.1 conserved hypothetical protein [Alkalilimnicola ehrlichii MLHE-1]